VEPFNDSIFEDEVINEINKDFRNMLSFAGSSEWLEDKEKKKKDSPAIIEPHNNTSSSNLTIFQSPVKSSPEYPEDNHEHPLSSSRLQDSKHVIRGSPGSVLKNFSSISKRIANDEYEMSRQDKPIIVEEGVKIASKDETVLKQKINNLVNEVPDLPADISWKLLEEAKKLCK